MATESWPPVSGLEQVLTYTIGCSVSYVYGSCKALNVVFKKNPTGDD
jgi:hypothetical protein